MYHMKRNLTAIALLFAAAGFTACEDTIDLDVPNGKTFTVVDGWITNVPGKQQIRLTTTVPYTSQGSAPAVTDAKITVTDITANKTYNFTYADGVYSYDPGAGQTIGEVGHVYKMRLELKEGVFEAMDTLKRVPVIDSIAADFKTKEEAISGKEGFFARFYAKDLAGATDWYWVRSYRNSLQSRVEDIFTIDGSYAEDVADGLNFIQPIAEGITDYDKPFQEGEKVIVRIASVTKRSHAFLDQVQQQIDNGGLFAKILENVPTNVLNTDKDAKGRVLGWFGTSAVSFKEKTMQK
ncbi:DUF4249 domain-containing protein [Chitinophaga rhizosphaerae]|uniref:DUF4249 domain-containing protein n=1 Tax=Chitinophaga rhizosphaerae TaxID=1864947 RepID=UPI000F803F79|nr:DUF4249 domain-containing protein [Chitinophaga rhizosphaerae]